MAAWRWSQMQTGKQEVTGSCGLSGAPWWQHCWSVNVSGERWVEDQEHLEKREVLLQ